MTFAEPMKQAQGFLLLEALLAASILAAALAAVFQAFAWARKLTEAGRETDAASRKLEAALWTLQATGRLSSQAVEDPVLGLARLEVARSKAADQPEFPVAQWDITLSWADGKNQSFVSVLRSTETGP